MNLNETVLQKLAEWRPTAGRQTLNLPEVGSGWAFALTVDRAGHDYLKTMCEDIGYEVVADIESLPSRLPTLYRKLTE